MVESVRVLPAARLRISGGRFPHRTGAPGLRRRLAIRESGAERNRVVDLLGPRRGRAQQEPANGYFPALVAGPVAASIEKAGARKSEPATGDVARRGESGAAADPDEDATGRRADRA